MLDGGWIKAKVDIDDDAKMSVKSERGALRAILRCSTARKRPRTADRLRKGS
jgi:hypothetical protein